MEINILGISCFYHDSAACLARDGEIIATVQKECRRSDKDYLDSLNIIDYNL